ncbi:MULTISPECIES: hypothetical protein [Streptomyces]|uniref:Uncharacterized protein n=1 Tax=Streptomyces albus (strain ATCC 21838 / DSM 41398 / FERM P-419 / JCM 4703 / NBRC 107858) TaxID=1081613 RepID=A0A0B5EMG6_STRA4|nr:hypothetical protein [Streptomyces sp. SCSIO ZS0520]AJE83673.1 hypothetical protein SLNWT_3297 [Streptomyces albus]AOU77981.1 hypothetical protein SLNHY_3290 [Streptomyces albus]AYN33736.1 hypothetical protein DUI70_3235 [Streptomyces albus]
MFSLALLPLVAPAAVCLLVCLLSCVYLWSGDTARRSRAWRLLRALLGRTP